MGRQVTATGRPTGLGRPRPAPPFQSPGAREAPATCSSAARPLSAWSGWPAGIRGCHRENGDLSRSLRLWPHSIACTTLIGERGATKICVRKTSSRKIIFRTRRRLVLPQAGKNSRAISRGTRNSHFGGAGGMRANDPLFFWRGPFARPLKNSQLTCGETQGI
jgi:hypothetical protein